MFLIKAKQLYRRAKLLLFREKQKAKIGALPRKQSRSLGTKLFGNVGLMTAHIAYHHHGYFNLLCPERLGNEIADGNAGPRGKNFL